MTFQETQRGGIWLPAGADVEFVRRRPLRESWRSSSSSDSLWVDVGIGNGNLEFSDAERTRTVKYSRVYWHRDPLCKQTVRLWTDYSVGSGMTFQTETAGVKEALERFWRSPRNRRITGAQGQRLSSVRLLVDGELFFAVAGEGPDAILRRIDPLEITALFPDPEDGETILFYRRDYVPAGASAPRTVYYRALGVAQEVLPDVMDGGRRINELVEPDVVVRHVAFDPFFHRGNSLLATVGKWAYAHGNFLQSRLTLIEALSAFAHQLVIQGGPEDIAAAKAAVEAITPGAGSAWVSNPGAELKAMPRDTGAAGARNDGDMIKLMVSAGSGIMLHYLGDPSTGNLATATAMELPMLKQFLSYQTLWTDTYKDIFRHIIGEEAFEAAEVDIDWPPILEADVAKVSQSMLQFSQAIPGLTETRAVQLQALLALGVNNQQEVLDELQKLTEERKAQAEKIAAGQSDAGNGRPGAPARPGNGQPGSSKEKSADGLLEALRGLRESL